MATPSDHDIGDSLEGSMLRSPWLTICNVVWGNRLAASPHTIGSKPVSFSSLWPGQNFIELYQHGRMENSLYEIVKLLLASSTFAPFDELLVNGIISWDTKFPGDVTLTHLVCAFNSTEGCNRLVRDAPPKTIWEMKDHLNNDPFSICFSPNLRKNLRKSIKSLNNKHNKAALSVNEPMTPQIRSQIFNLASEAEGLYYLTVLLQLYQFDINEEKDDNGNMLLHVAASGGLPCLAHIFYLVDYYRGDITQPNEQGLTPVHIAAMIGDEKLTEVLICVFGMGVNSCDIVKKWTPLHFAARYNKLKLIDMLLERGADLRKDDIDGCIPSLVAQKYSSIECLNLLEHHTNKRDHMLLQQATEGTLDVHSLYPSDLALVSDSGFTLLMKAVLGNQPVLVRKLLSQPSCPKDFKQFKLPRPNELPSIKDQSKKTAMIMAAENGLLECLRILLEKNADPTIEDCEGMKPLHFAVENNHKDCVRCIVNHPRGLNGLKLAVSLAEKNSRSDIAHIIREAMAKRHKEVVTPLLFKIAQSGDKDELYTLLEDGDDVNETNDVSDWPLYVASAFGNVEIVKLLSEAGGHVVKHHRLNLCTPLHVAARGGHAEVIRFLLGFCSDHSKTALVDPAKSYLDINEKNAMQETPLELAVCQGHMTVVRLLLDHGAVTTLPDSNSSLLSCPAFCGIQFLIESRRKEQMDKVVRALKDQMPLKEFKSLWKGPSDFNLRDGHGDTVLMVAAKYTKPDVMDFLLQSAVLYTADMRIAWNYNKRSFKPPPVTSTPVKDEFEESLPSELPSRMRDDYLDYRPHTASVLETSLGSRHYRPTRGGKNNGGNRAGGRRYGEGGGYMSNDTSEDDDTSLSGSFNTRYTFTNPTPIVQASPASAAPVDERPSAYMNVVLKGNGPCTQSGLLCLVNTYDRCSALHRAIEGNQFKMVPLLLAADPNIVDLQDKNGQSALHKACQNNHKKCIQALCTSPVVLIDPLIRDVNNKLAEDLVIQPRLKKLVNNYRVKYTKQSHPTNRPLPPAPSPSDPPNQSHDNGISLEPLTPPRVDGGMSHPPQLSPITPLATTTPHYESDHVSHRSPSYQYARLNHQPSNINPSNAVSFPRNNLPPPTISEQDSSEDDIDRPRPNPRKQPQPRYITHNPKNGMDNGRRNRGYSNGGSLHPNGIVSDDGGHYSRLNCRTTTNGVVPPLPNQVQPQIVARANEIRRNLTFEVSDSMMSSD